jgi:hypothetical protein
MWDLVPWAAHWAEGQSKKSQKYLADDAHKITRCTWAGGTPGRIQCTMYISYFEMKLGMLAQIWPFQYVIDVTLLLPL